MQKNYNSESQKAEYDFATFKNALFDSILGLISRNRYKVTQLCMYVSCDNTNLIVTLPYMPLKQSYATEEVWLHSGEKFGNFEEIIPLPDAIKQIPDESGDLKINNISHLINTEFHVQQFTMLLHFISGDSIVDRRMRTFIV